MPLPEFNNNGDLPPGVHRTSWSEVLQRFGVGVGQREVRLSVADQNAALWT